LALWAIETIGITGGFYVAIDASPRQSPQAYIFDAGWMEADFGLRDLATLEVTTILFNSAQMNEDFVYVTTLLYDSGFIPGSLRADVEVADFAGNSHALIAAIRRASGRRDDVRFGGRPVAGA
jgi:hypothetical protein